MKYLVRITLILATLFCLTSVSAKTYHLKNCKQLRNPKAVLMVHATWCSFCKRYLPTYQAVSNRPEFKDYKFYTYLNDNSRPVCGYRVSTVPTTFGKNMKKRLVGAVSAARLRQFVKSSS